jgi:aryl-alcohol dehydrogenase-like predicted oxidoreductase
MALLSLAEHRSYAPRRTNRSARVALSRGVRWVRTGRWDGTVGPGADPFRLSHPANQRKLDAVEELAQLADEAGVTLTQLAIAFVLCHPAITAAQIGPRRRPRSGLWSA